MRRIYPQLESEQAFCISLGAVLMTNRRMVWNGRFGFGARFEDCYDG